MPTIDRNTAVVDATTEIANPQSSPAKSEQIGLRQSLVFGAATVVLVSWVALYNGYPTIFPDTGSYLLTGVFHVAFAPFRAPGYSAFTKWTSLRISGWFTIAAQAIIVVYLVREALAFLFGGDRAFADRRLVATVALLAALTALPWLVSMLMPDVFAGTLFVSAYLLAFDGALHPARRIILASILMISVAAHTSLFPIAALSVPALFFLTTVRPQSRVTSAKAAALAAWLLIPIIAAGYWTATQNENMRRGFTLSPSKNTFLLGRLFGDGLAADFLRENCPKRPFISCRYLNNLPHTEQQFLFQHPLLHDLSKQPDEIETIVRGTISAYPLTFVISSAKQTVLQLMALRTGEEMRLHAANVWNIRVIERVFPRDFSAFSNGRQFRDGPRSLADAIAPVHTAVFWLSTAACLLFARSGRFPRINTFFVSATVFLVINAGVSGALAGVYDRYQSRVAWIIPLCLTAYFCSWMAEEKGGYLDGPTAAEARRDTRSDRLSLVRTPKHRGSENSSTAG